MSDNKKTSSKKPNSYSLLLKGFSEVQKKNPPKSSTSKNSQTPIQRSGTPESRMNSQNIQSESSQGKPGESQDPDIPDRSYGDYYCKLCDSHMNSDNMWEAHITGKRHIKNVKKGDADSKYEDLPDVESSIKYEIRNVKDPIVGLSYIHEIRRKEPNVPPIYNCFLCHASIATVPLVTEHVISMKHRLNFIKENNPDEYQLIEATNLKKGHMEPLVVEAARKMELQLGRGTVKVKQEKKKSPVYTYSSKKTINLEDSGDDDDDRYHKTRKGSRFDDSSSSSLWKSVDTERNFGQWEKSRSLRDFEDTGRNFGQWDKSRNSKDFQDNYRNHSRSRSPRDFKERKHVSYSDEEFEMENYKRSYSKRDISPRQDKYDSHKSFSKREISPKHDYRHLKSTDDYLQPSRKIDSLNIDRSDYLTPRYGHTSNTVYNMQSANKPFTNLESAASFLPKDNLLPSLEKSVKKPKTVDDILQDTLLLSSEDCYWLFSQRLQLLPEISNVNEILAITKLISEAQKKLKEKLSGQFIAALLKYQKSDNQTNIIPGLSDSISSSAELPSIRTDNSNKPTDAESFISNILKSANYSPVNKMPTSQEKTSFPYSLPTSYASAISSQQSGPLNTYQAPSNYQTPSPNYQPPVNYQGSSLNSFQGASTSSYPNQAAYQQSNTNMQYSSSSAPSYSSNIPPGSGNKSIPQSQVYNYPRYSSPSSMSSSAPKNYPRKY